MSLLARVVRTFSVWLLISFLAACGGSGDPPAEVAKVDDRTSPFVGKWVACTPISGSSGSEQEEIQVDSIGNNKATVTWKLTQYDASTNCSGLPLKLREEKTEVTMQGTTVTVHDPVIGSVNLETLTQIGHLIGYRPANPPTSSVPSTAFAGLVTGATTVLRIADPDKLDSQGLPTALLPQIFRKTI
jgi:hypothetical protein